MILLFIGAIALIVIGIMLYTVLLRGTGDIGIFKGKITYLDTQTKQGKLLKATSLPLIGKPDYLVKVGNDIIPVDIKTGKTPQSPYTSHVMQLMAYCYLIEDVLGTRPKGGYLRYPKKEYKIEYTDEAKESVTRLVSEILKLKKHNREIHCSHKSHYQK